MPRHRAWTRVKPLHCPFAPWWEPLSPSRTPMMVQEKTYGFLPPDAAVPEAIKERRRTHRRRDLCGRSVNWPSVRVFSAVCTDCYGVMSASASALRRSGLNVAFWYASQGVK